MEIEEELESIEQSRLKPLLRDERERELKTEN